MLPFFEHKTSILQSRRKLDTFNFPLHMHLATEFIYINEGQLCIEYPDCSFNLSKGDFAVIFPYTIHGYTSITPVVDYTLAISRHDIYGDYENTLLQKHPANPLIKSSDLPDDIPMLMNELVSLNDCNEQSPLIKAIVSLILARTLPLFHLKPNTEKFKTNLSVRAVTYVTEHFKENISLDTAADALGISRFDVSRLFSSSIKINFVKYVNFLRIAYAKELLETTNISVLNIALECGYESLRTFNRTFKSHTGTTPLKYRMEKKA